MREQFTEWWSELGPIQVQNWWPHYDLLVDDDFETSVVRGEPYFINNNEISVRVFNKGDAPFVPFEPKHRDAFYDEHEWKPRIYGVTLYGDGRIEYHKDVFE